MSSLNAQLKLREFIKLQPLHLSLWREIKREDNKICNLINTRLFTFDLTLADLFRPGYIHFRLWKKITNSTAANTIIAINIQKAK